LAEDLGASSLESFWAGISFLLTVVVSQPIITSISDIFGRFHLNNICIGLFFAGSVIMGCAQNVRVLILGRVIQGVGGGGLDVLNEIIVTDMTTLKERPLYLGLLGIPIAAGSVTGPVIGGVFTASVSWRWIAWINLPCLGCALVLSLLFMRLTPIKQSTRQKLQQLDWIGMLLFASGLSSLILPVSWGGSIYPWRSWRTILPIVLGSLALLIFVLHESKVSDPMLPYRPFAARTALLSLLLAFLHGFAVYSVLFYLPILFEGVRQQGPIQSAISAFPLSFTAIPFGMLAALAVHFWRRYSPPIWLGWVCIATGMGLVSLLDMKSSLAMQVGSQFLTGIGFGILYTILPIPLQASVDKDDVGVATGTLIFVRLLGAVFGLAVGSTIFSAQFGSAISILAPLPLAVQPLADTSQAISFIPHLKHISLDEQVKQSILLAYCSGVRPIWISAAAVGAIGFVASLFMEELSLEKDEVGRQAFVRESKHSSESSLEATGTS
jgi:Major Facilitator Superfamily